MTVSMSVRDLNRRRLNGELAAATVERLEAMLARSRVYHIHTSARFTLTSVAARLTNDTGISRKGRGDASVADAGADLAS